MKKRHEEDDEYAGGLEHAQSVPDPGNLSLRYLPSGVFQEDERVPKAFAQFVEHDLLPTMNSFPVSTYLVGRQIRLVTRCFHALVTSGLRKHVVADPRANDAKGAKFRRPIWDSIEAAGYLVKCRGTEASERVTRYQAAKLLLDKHSKWTLRMLEELSLVRNSEMAVASRYALVVINTGKRNPVTGEVRSDSQRSKPLSVRSEINRLAAHVDPKQRDRFRAESLATVREEEEMMNGINAANLKHTWELLIPDGDGVERSCPVNPCLREIHIGEWNRGARFYSWGELGGQSIPKQLRSGLLIGGERTVELDFECMALRMLYHKNQYDPSGDLYRPAELFPNAHKSDPECRDLLRSLAKRATNICWNVTSRQDAITAVNDLIYNGSGESPFSDMERSVLQDVLTHSEKRMKGTQIVEQLERMHIRLFHHFYREVGLDLMTHESRIMGSILWAFSQAGKPVLGIHDAIVCRRSDVVFAQLKMNDRYFEYTGFKPILRVSP